MPDKVPVRAKLFYEELQPSVGVSFRIRLLRFDENTQAIYGPDNSPARTLFYLTADKDGEAEIELVPNDAFSVKTTVYEFEIVEERAGITRTSRFVVPNDDIPQVGYWELNELLRRYEQPSPVYSFERGWVLRSTEPTNPTLGAGWINSNNHELRYWDGTEWVLIGVVGGGTLTDVEIKAAYERNNDTNVFTDAEKEKLANIEDNATIDQTPTEIVESIDSELGTGWRTGTTPGGGGGQPVAPPVAAVAHYFSTTEDPASLTRVPAGVEDITLNEDTYDLRINLAVPTDQIFVLLVPSNVLPTRIVQLGFDVTSLYVTTHNLIVGNITYNIYRNANQAGTELIYDLELQR